MHVDVGDAPAPYQTFDETGFPKKILQAVSGSVARPLLLHVQWT